MKGEKSQNQKYNAESILRLSFQIPDSSVTPTEKSNMKRLDN